MNDKTNLPAERRADALPADSAPDKLGALWQSFEDMARDPEVSPEKMRTLFELQRDMREVQRQEEFAQAKAAAMAEMPTITKNRYISDKSGKVRSRYSDFKQLYSHVQPVLKKHGLALAFDVAEMPPETVKAGLVLRVAPILSHKNGVTERGGYMPVPIEKANQTVTLQQAAKGSVETGKRTVLIATLGIIEEENPEDYGAPREVAPPRQSDENDLLANARFAAGKGLSAYEVFFNARSTDERRWLVDSGHHVKLKSGEIEDE